MAAKVKTPKVKTPVGMVVSKDFFVVDLRAVRGNPFQPRNSALPGCLSAGYPLWEVEREEGKVKTNAEEFPAIWSLLMSEKAEDQAKAVGLIKEHDEDLVELAQSLIAGGQLQNVGVALVDPEDDGKGIYIVYGMRRCIARAFNHARSAGELPLNVKAEWKRPEDIKDEHDLQFQAMLENRGRKDENIIEQAKRYAWMRKQGLSNAKIAERTGDNQQNVYNRLALLKLPLEEQERVAAGKLGMVKALENHRQREKAKAEQKKAEQEALAAGKEIPVAAPLPEAKDIPSERKRTLALKQMEKLYSSLVNPEKLGNFVVTEELWALAKTPEVRKFMALQIDVEYESFQDMKARMKEEERAALELQELEARKAAEEQEAEFSEADV